MSKPRTITIRNKRTKDTVDILGLTHGDCRLLAGALSEGAFGGGDQGGPRSRALLRFASALRVPANFPDQHSDVILVGATSDPSTLYEETVNL